MIRLVELTGNHQNWLFEAKGVRVTKPHANAPVKSAEGVVTIVGPVNSALCGVAGPSSDPSATAHLDGETETLEGWNS
jgi:hypothetical protein